MFGRRSKRTIETNIIFKEWNSAQSEEEKERPEPLADGPAEEPVSASDPIPEPESKTGSRRLFRSSRTLQQKSEPNYQAGDSVQVDGDPQAERTLADLLKCYGRYAFDLDNGEAEVVQGVCYDYAEQILNRIRQETVRLPEPEWAELEEFFASHRSKEQRYVKTTLKDFRGVIWEFIRELSRTVSEDKSENEIINRHLAILRESVETNSPRDLKEKIVSVVHFIGKAIERREQKQRAQMKQFGERLRTLRAELVMVRKKATLDPLTRVYNRTALDEHLKRVVELCGFSGENACLYMVDADHFKQVNDSYGHPVGDAVLKVLADTCIRCFPRKTDFVARYGGEEFAVIVEGGTPEGCRELGQRLIDAVHSRLIPVNDDEIRVTVSVGMAVLETGESAEQWVTRADDALLLAKQNGRNRLEVA